MLDIDVERDDGACALESASGTARTRTTPGRRRLRPGIRVTGENGTARPAAGARSPAFLIRCFFRGERSPRGAVSCACRRTGALLTSVRVGNILRLQRVPARSLAANGAHRAAPQSRSCPGASLLHGCTSSPAVRSSMPRRSGAAAASCPARKRCSAISRGSALVTTHPLVAVLPPERSGGGEARRGS